MHFKTFIKQLVARLPQRLPIEVANFDPFIADFISTYPDLPQVPYENIKYVIATSILNEKDSNPKRSKHSFYNEVLVAAQKQIASQAFHDIKQAQLEAAKKALEDKAAAQKELPPNDGL